MLILNIQLLIQKEKNYIYYSLNISVVEEVMLWLAELKGESEDDEEK